ncbi:MAG TPA: acetolactate synthase large subunit [Candidatus Limnocylindria bacterium]|nr:acetolactate synthase large subunit [Candidatus Limnocylindria bacterium]
MNAAELLVRCLENEGVRYVFGIPGEETLALNEALDRSEKIRFILTRHEQGAAFMADVYGRLSSYPGVCLATLGPGATNLLTGVADAQLDRAPLVAITGQAGLERVHKESHQYIDVVGMFEPVTKWSTRVTVADSVPEIVRKAFRLARIEKPGATHIELPEDIAVEEVDMAPLEVRRTSYPKAQDEAIARAAELVDAATHPLILAGNGVLRRDATGRPTVDTLRRFVQRSRIWATHTYMAKGALVPFGQHSLPPVGLQRPGAELENVKPLAEADLVIAIGYDLVEWAPVLWNPKRDKQVVHIDTTPAELDGHYQPSIEVVGELHESLEALAERVHPRDDRGWVFAHAAARRVDDRTPLAPETVVDDLRAALGPDDIVVSDVGAHKVWLSRLFPTEAPNTVIVSNGLASMGIALPGAIAAKLVRPQRKVVAFTGDGGFLMNVQELETAKRIGAAVCVVVLVDERLGVIEANERRTYRRTFGTEFSNPDFVELARAFGIAGYAVESAKDLLPTLRHALDIEGPSVVAVPWDHTANDRIARTAIGRGPVTAG